MKYALTTFALIVTLLGGFIFGAYYMYRKNNPVEKPVEQVNEAPTQEEAMDSSKYFDSEGNWIFRYNENENWDGGDGSTVLIREDAAENIDYRITGTNFVYEDDGLYSGFHAVVTIENVGQSNLYLGRDSVFNIEDRNLEVVDSYDFVRAVPDVIAPGEKGFFYVPYGHIKTREDSVTIEADELTGDTPNPGEASSAESSSNGEDVNAIDIDELEKALMEEGLTTSALTITKDAEVRMSAAEGAGTSSINDSDKSGGTELLPADDESTSSPKGKANVKDNVPVEDVKEASTSDSSSDKSADEKNSNSDAGKSGEDDKKTDAADKDSSSDDKENTSKTDSTDDAAAEKSDDKDSEKTDADDSEKADAASSDEKTESESGVEDSSQTEEEADNSAEEGESEDSADGTDEGASDSATEGTSTKKAEYPGLSLYRVNEYFIMPDLDVKKCIGDPRKDFDIANIMYGSNASGYFTLSADVTNSSDENVDYVPVTVIALDRRGNAIAAGADSITDFYKGAKKNFGVSYILTREQRSNIVQCVIYAREVVNKK